MLLSTVLIPFPIIAPIYPTFCGDGSNCQLPLIFIKDAESILEIHLALTILMTSCRITQPQINPHNGVVILN